VLVFYEKREKNRREGRKIRAERKRRSWGITRRKKKKFKKI
jgi:hypothetical protein